MTSRNKHVRRKRQVRNLLKAALGRYRKRQSLKSADGLGDSVAEQLLTKNNLSPSEKSSKNGSILLNSRDSDEFSTTSSVNSYDLGNFVIPLGKIISFIEAMSHCVKECHMMPFFIPIFLMECFVLSNLNAISAEKLSLLCPQCFI